MWQLLVLISVFTIGLFWLLSTQPFELEFRVETHSAFDFYEETENSKNSGK